jgi:thiol:disulfide interchange protein
LRLRGRRPDVRDEVLRQVGAATFFILGGCGSASSKAVPVDDVQIGSARPPEVTVLPPSSSAASRARPGDELPWESDELEALTRAKKRNQPILIFVSAKWSVPSREMERTVWRDPRIARFAPRFVWLKLDLTDGTDEDEMTMKRYGVVSVPWIVMIEPDGTRSVVAKESVSIDVLEKALTRASAP